MRWTLRVSKCCRCACGARGASERAAECRARRCCGLVVARKTFSEKKKRKEARALHFWGRCRNEKCESSWSWKSTLPRSQSHAPQSQTQSKAQTPTCATSSSARISSYAFRTRLTSVVRYAAAATAVPRHFRRRPNFFVGAPHTPTHTHRHHTMATTTTTT
jgi:hypothetical protein